MRAPSLLSRITTGTTRHMISVSKDVYNYKGMEFLELDLGNKIVIHEQSMTKDTTSHQLSRNLPMPIIGELLRDPRQGQQSKSCVLQNTNTNQGDQEDSQRDLAGTIGESLQGPPIRGKLKNLEAEVQRNKNLLKGQGASKAGSTLSKERLRQSQRQRRSHLNQTKPTSQDRFCGRPQNRADSHPKPDPSQHQRADSTKSKIQARVNIVAFMTRKRSSSSLHPFDLEIEKTLNKIKKSKNMHVGHTSDSTSSIPEIDNFDIKPGFANNLLYKPESMENNDRTLKELVKPDILYQPWCIQYPQLEPA
ncbi:hypothetical protein CR513_13762, partial [Mucuna pruriens]